jgi:hypothetical protein
MASHRRCLSLVPRVRLGGTCRVRGGVSGALLGPEGPAGWRAFEHGWWLVSWSGPALVFTSVCSLLRWGADAGVDRLGVGAGCLLRTAQWTRASSSDVRRVIIL